MKTDGLDKAIQHVYNEGVRAGRRAVLEEVVERNDMCGRVVHLNANKCPEHWGDAVDSYCNHCWATAELERLKGEP